MTLDLNMRVIRWNWRSYPLICSGHCCVWGWPVNRWEMNLPGATDESGVPPLWMQLRSPGSLGLFLSVSEVRLPQWGGAGHAADLTTGHPRRLR